MAHLLSLCDLYQQIVHPSCVALLQSGLKFAPVAVCVRVIRSRRITNDTIFSVLDRSRYNTENIVL